MSLLRYHKYRPTETPIIIAPDPATVPAIFILFEDFLSVTSAIGVGDAPEENSTIGEAAIVAELLEPKTEVVFLEEACDGEFLGVGLGDFDLEGVEEVDCDSEV